MATYNGAKYLPEQIDSILSQTIQDIEIVISDDCSTDNSWSVLEKYAAQDSRIKIFRNKTNLGFKKNFENVIGFTSGEYVALCDQDDIWEPNHLEVLLDNLSNKMISAGNSEMVDGEGNSIGITLKELEAFDTENDSFQLAMSFLLFRNPVQGSAMLIKREFFSKALPIPSDIKYHDAWFSVLSCFYGGLSYIDMVVTNYRMHNSNVTGHRIKKKSRIWFLLRCTIRCDMSVDRIAMIRTIRERVDNLSKEHLNLINSCEKVLLRNRSLVGRLLNFVFRIRHFRTIYTY